MKSERARLDAADFPLLSQFVAGYLHQDFVIDHKTPEGARDAFLDDASDWERLAFLKEVHRFLTEAEGRPWAEVKAAFSSMGGAWTPRSRLALATLFRGALQRHRARQARASEE
jgi:hypothetical protein